MKFLGKKDEQITHNFPIEDYIDYEIIASLTPRHQQLLSKLLEKPSSSIEKLFNKIASNQVYLNADMLSKLFEHLTFQSHLPLEILQNPLMEPLWEEYLQKYTQNISSPKQNIWNKLLDELKIWPNTGFSYSITNKLINICHDLITNDICPSFDTTISHEPKTKFWQKNPTYSQQCIMETMFKFIYEKMKFFHWELIPNAKRPIDLYELYCLLEDAALEQKIIVYSENILNFLRPLNATSLIYSTIFSFPMAFPDYVAEKISHQEKTLAPFFLKFFDNSNFQPVFAQHQNLKNYNRTAFIETLQHISDSKFKDLENEQILNQLLNQTEAVILARYLENHTGRLIFTFNRLTSLGYLLRSPILKGLGYHPLINTEVPTKLKHNFEVFIQLLKNESYENQMQVIDYIKSYNLSKTNFQNSVNTPRLN